MPSTTCAVSSGLRLDPDQRIEIEDEDHEVTQMLLDRAL